MAELNKLWGVVRVCREDGVPLTVYPMNLPNGSRARAQEWCEMLTRHKTNPFILTYEVWPAEDVDRLRVQQALTETGAE